jgi:aminoglycoside/choline kinase family phosphotransferase
LETLKELRIQELFTKWSDEPVSSFSALPPSGSYREYYRIQSQNFSVIGVYNPDFKENQAFVKFSRHFHEKGLNVPEILVEDLENNIYLQTDLGDVTLFSFMSAVRQGGDFPAGVIEIYKKVIDQLPGFQVNAAENFDYSYCYPRASFDRQSMMWDVNYFKYYFLKLAKISFDEQHLEDDFQTFTDYLLQAPSNYFLYRDLQSRNIMLYEGKPYFIDYQGGRRGALQYDLASLLYDAKADIPQEVRDELREYYIEVLSRKIQVNKEEFNQYFYAYAIIRIMQAMGAYGFRGFYEKKAHFLKSIPFALKNLEGLLNSINLPVQVPTLIQVLRSVTQSEFLKKIGGANISLTVSVYSFSYRKGYPEDKSGNGGGFIFDCRGLHNPGRYEEYKHLTGKDKPVIDFLENEGEVFEFLNSAFELVDKSIDKYLQRKFQHLLVAFGCTGGQHRSVYSAESMARHLRDKFPNIEVILHHREQQHLN